MRRRWEHLVENEQVPLGVADDTPVTTRWHVPAIGLLAVAVVGVVVVALT